NAVFGENREIQGKTIIPVASVRYGFGAGGGEGTGPAVGEGQPPTTGSGGGGGGMVRAKPVAVLEITPDETRVLPVMDYTRLASMALGGVFFIWFLRTIRRKAK
ncbi:MAG: spore germination protein GerW family protein, partial [Dehalococcoidia bacterium]|nr:spore germination protein GerW family protein [Dehalococcoidia bacterium]